MGIFWKPSLMLHPTEGWSHELLKIAIMGIVEPFCYLYHDAVIRVKPYFTRLSGIMISLEFLVNFLNKFKCLSRIKPYINLLGLKIALNRSFPWYIFYF
jgi:hypothetical protein